MAFARVSPPPCDLRARLFFAERRAARVSSEAQSFPADGKWRRPKLKPRAAGGNTIITRHAEEGPGPSLANLKPGDRPELTRSGGAPVSNASNSAATLDTVRPWPICPNFAQRSTVLHDYRPGSLSDRTARQSRLRLGF